MKRALLFSTLLYMCSAARAQQGYGMSLAEGLEYEVELQATTGSGEHSPLWLNANKYGLSSLEKNNGFVRAALYRPVETDDDRRWGIGYGLDVAGAYHFTSNVVIQQAYVDVRWLSGMLTMGSKEQPLELKNSELSSGSQTFGINARPVPQVRLALPDYWDIPGTAGWVGLKGHFAYGMMTDEKWQEEFTAAQSKYTKKTLYHSKAGYLRIGPRNITLELGIEMACQFGGTSYNCVGSGSVIENKKGLRSFFNALIPGGTDVGESDVEGAYENADGNHVGSWVARLSFDYPAWNLGLYADHYFEDHSSMLFLDYDGYGSGDKWNSKETSRYFMYDLKDIMLGAELQLKEVPWLSNLVFEYIYTKYQSGPVYHDHTKNLSTHISGRDNYYNHSIFTGWQHWGQVMGNPLYRSPLYNETGKIETEANRFYGFCLGLCGDPTQTLHYRLRGSWQKAFGTYVRPYANPKENLSLLAEATYTFPEESRLSGWSVRAGVGYDKGRLLGDNVGFQLTVTKWGLLNF